MARPKNRDGTTRPAGKAREKRQPAKQREKQRSRNRKRTAPPAAHGATAAEDGREALPDGDGRAARGERGDGGRGTRGREGVGNRRAELKPPPPRREWSAPGGSPTASRGGTARGRAPTARSGAGRSGPGAGRGAGAARRAGAGGARRPRARSLWHEYGLRADGETAASARSVAARAAAAG